MDFGPSARNPEPSALICWRGRGAMQRHSESIGAIAGALAKAPVELANSEKSLVATNAQIYGEPTERRHPDASAA